nr:unnamed protein product [Spirometra erinaceieuropaei]
MACLPNKDNAGNPVLDPLSRMKLLDQRIIVDFSDSVQLLSYFHMHSSRVLEALEDRLGSCPLCGRMGQQL